MNIVEIRGYELAATMGAPIRNSVGVIGHRTALVVELVTDGGPSGWGETQDDPASAWRSIESRFAGRLLGADPFDPALDAIALDPSTREDALAGSALDLALWDLRARSLRVPLADLAGEVLRDTVPAYASGPFLSVDGDPFDGIVERAVAVAARGFRALKLRAGVTPAADLAVVAELRERLPGVAIAIDINTGYSREDAAELARLSRGSGVAWIEEPVASTDVEGFVALASLTDVPLAGGESLWRYDDAAALVGSGALAVLQPDLYLCGGVTGMLRLAALADAAGIPLLPHVFGSGINLAASLQVAAVLPARGDGFPWFELDQSDNPLRAIGGAVAIDADGCLPIPTTPGIGIAPSRDDLAPFVREQHALSLAKAGHR
ncbi:MAG: hypothetical protein JWN36_70 [Microbacteriaceae bacterium]|nr:hypothetical protein [Microbacteriaceae bacterium]